MSRHLQGDPPSSRYVEQTPGKFVGDTRCNKLPVRVCGAGCVVEEGPEECHDKQIDTLVDVPEESCDLNPQKTCRLVTRLVPSLDPKRECTTIPKEICSLKFSQPSRESKPLRTEWCLGDDDEAEVLAQPGILPRTTTTSRPRTTRRTLRPRTSLTPQVIEFPQQEIEPVAAPASYTAGSLLQELRRLRRKLATM